MPALYDETWCARMQLEKMRLLFGHLTKSGSEQKAKPISEEGKADNMTQETTAVHPPLNEGTWD